MTDVTLRTGFAANQPVLYMRGFATEMPVPPDMVSDAKALIELPDEVVRDLEQALTSQQGFLDRDGLFALCEKIVGAPHARRVARFVLAAHRFPGRGGVEDLLRELDDYVQDERKRSLGVITAEELVRLRERLPSVVLRVPALALQQKAERLSEGTGQPLLDLQLLCDLRPVFDEERSCVEGMIPLTTLKVTCVGPDGLPVTTEALLSRRQVNELASKATAALQKLEVLCKLLDEKGVSIPVLPATRPTDEQERGADE